MALELNENFDLNTESFFRNAGWLSPNETIISYEKAGEGNMNFVFRLTTNARSIIVKQSRAYVQKYPQIAAPIERIFVEDAYYQQIASNQTMASFSPKVLIVDKTNHLMLMEDLGKGSDYSFLYKRDMVINEADLLQFVTYLNALHDIEPVNFIDNSGMKNLNAEHLYNYPFLVENGFNLELIQEGLQVLANHFKTNETLKKAISAINKRYLSNGKYLLHGDFYFGSWLKVGDKPKIIDPEFAFCGDREFDLGVMIAHLKMAQQPSELINKVLEKYAHSIDSKLLNAYIGCEILRRIIGLAQLPLELNLDEKESLCYEAQNLILA
ncbi:Methylthioribose kinase [Emticicia aquatica]|uniref:Methylthioribose kinase n=1 Tax=Emticicia aquatica TaxID=1681835 RepID=A0ABM9AQK5_9BACT|nr:phosphotransferase [Emticicia aquatica]CAH0996139.1 Methylthioribose kinase [Emticicia aquatica]